MHVEEAGEEDAVLVGRLGAVRGDAPVGDEAGRGLGRFQAVEAEDGVGVADVECEKHTSSQSSSRTPPECTVRRP